MKIYLIRHSESIDDIQDCYGGIADYPLSETGKNKVIAYRHTLVDTGIEKIYASPYQRAFQTAQILNEVLQKNIETIEGIRELNSYGILSGVNKQQAKEIFAHVLKKPEYQKVGYYFGKTFLGGEDIQEFDERVKNGMEYILQKSSDLSVIAIVTHGGVYRSIYQNILKIDQKIEDLEDLATTILTYEKGNYKIVQTKGVLLGEKIKK